MYTQYPRYHSNCVARATPLFGLQQALGTYAACAEGPTGEIPLGHSARKGWDVFSAVYRASTNARLSEKPTRISVFVIAFCDHSIVGHMIASLSYFVKMGERNCSLASSWVKRKSCHSERSTKCGVEESSHYVNIRSQIGAKILRLAALAQDDNASATSR